MVLTAESLPAHTEPLSIGELGIDHAIVRDIAIKTMFYGGRFTRSQLASALKLSMPVVDDLLHALSRDGVVTVLAPEEARIQSYALTGLGYERAEEALRRNSYVGAAPVSLAAYVERVRAQSVASMQIDAVEIERALDPLVLDAATVRRVAWAGASRKPLLVHGASGNGKTTMAQLLGSVVGGTIHIPYAIEVMGQIVRIFDESKHHRAASSDTWLPEDMRAKGDGRWVEIERPLIWAGGELTPSSLELTYDADTRIYEAPLQLKANGGIFIIDDLGRQQMPAVQLLNRWILALESQIDHLTLHTGQMLEVPFDVLLLFSTNLPPEDLADEAFLRRIRYKVRIDDPTEDEFRQIFARECVQRGVSFDGATVEHLLRGWYGDGRPMRGCHPRDLLEAAGDIARSAGGLRVLTPELIDEACEAYFL